MCISDGILRAKLDGELEQREAQAVEAHIAGCARCRARAEEISARAGEVRTFFAELPADAGAGADPAAALARLRARSRMTADRRVPLLARLFPPRWSPAWGVMAALVVMTVLVTSSSARAGAQRILGLFRAKSVVVVPMDRNLVANGQGKVIGDFFSKNVTITKQEKPVDSPNREEAGRLSGMGVRLPSLRADAPALTVLGAHAFYLKVDLERVRTLLDVLGRPDFPIPNGLDGATIAVDVPRGVKAAYGKCPAEHEGPPPKEIEWENCVVVTQVPSPAVVTMPELDLGAIAEAALQFSGMTAEEARAFSKNVDWTSTMAVALPRDSGTSETVTVDGVNGALLVTRPRQSWPGGWAVVWVKNGVVYSVMGFGSPALALQLANSLG